MSAWSGMSATRAGMAAPAAIRRAGITTGKPQRQFAAAPGFVRTNTTLKPSGVPGRRCLASFQRKFAPLETRKISGHRKRMSVSAAAVPSGVSGVVPSQLVEVVSAMSVALLGTLKACFLQAMTAAQAMIDDPWRPEEFWHWVLYFWVLKPTLWYAYKFVQILRGKQDVISQENFKLSFFGFLKDPLYIHGLGMAFNWFADSMVALCHWMDAPDHKIVQMMSSWDTGVYIIVGGVFLYKLQDYYLDEFLDIVAGKNKVSLGAQDLIHRGLELTIILGTFALATISMGVSRELIASVYSLMGIGIGFASKEVIQNFFGGLMLWTMRPFKVGENIFFLHPEGKLERQGKVVRIGYYQTVVTTDEGATYVPNQWFVSGEIINYSRTSSNFELREYQKTAL
eukprot:CAMPEP_0118938988 /NCGR_PEP_ID=MMETSP1169-20130426/27633_1 /TAXON_ID=36882 /ORGANISM="Pyramimonas obovata, Strain CCMP722" /LENGTH=396 /DNA_ID=CAMNT_0006883135 /DNA_START=88 /DNA_END=1275 /DNA_ORIENTATION=-